MVQASFAGFIFEIAEEAMLFSDLKFSGECAVEENTSGTAQYVSRKNGKAGQVSFTAYLNAGLGVNVRKTALEFEAAARHGQTGTLAVGEEALLPYKMMLVKAEVSEIVISPTGAWTSAKVALTLRQAGVDGKDGYTGSSGGAFSTGGSGGTGGDGVFNIGEAVIRGGTEAVKEGLKWRDLDSKNLAEKTLEARKSEIAKIKQICDRAKRVPSPIPKKVSNSKISAAISTRKK